jgi:hypothetical protein
LQGPLLAGWRFWNVVLSTALFVYAGYRILSAPGPGAGLAALLALVPILGFIWVCDYWAAWLGPLFGGGHYAKSVDSSSPAWLIALFGWIILLTVLALALA